MAAGKEGPPEAATDDETRRYRGFVARVGGDPEAAGAVGQEGGT